MNPRAPGRGEGAIASLVPALGWLRSYDRDDLRGDLAAGVTVGVMLIPQGMAYALIAGLDPIYGLYAALVPLVVYPLFGTSRVLAVGPVAIVSLFVAAAVAPMANGDPARYIALAVALTVLSGLIQLGLGVARAGFLVNFLSHPVLTGFTAAAALIIGLSQLQHLLGVPIPRSPHAHELVADAVRRLGAVDAATLAIGTGAIALLVAARRWKPTFPAPLAVVALATLGVWALGLSERGVAIVGDVPAGLPGFGIPDVGVADLGALLPAALIISLVGFMESIAVAKVYAARDLYEVDPNRELVALGLANLAGAGFQSYPVTGGFSRTAVNDRAGARTPLASILSAAVIALTLLFLTPLFHHLPRAVLAAIVLVAVAGLVQTEELRFLWRVRRREFWVMAATFAATLGLGIELGIGVGVILSLVLVIHDSYRPHTAIMGRLPGTRTFRNVSRHPEALVRSGAVVFRVDAPLYFANASFLKDSVRRIVREDPSLSVLILDAYPVNQVDSTAAHALKTLIEELQDRDIRVLFAGVKGPVKDVLERAGIVKRVGEENFFYEVHQAMDAADPDRARPGPSVGVSRGRPRPSQGRMPLQERPVATTHTVRSRSKKKR